MGEADIIRRTFCIKRIISVVKGENPHHHKLLSVNGRHSDAFVYVISGSCTYGSDNGMEFTATPGDVLYLPYRSVYTMYIHTEDYRFIFCDLEFDAAAEERGGLYCSHGVKNAGALFEKLYNRYRSPSQSSQAECMSVLYGIYGAIQQSEQHAYIDRSRKKDMMDAVRYIDGNFRNADMSVAMLAEGCGISEVYFRKLFKARYGLAPSKYLLTVRLDNAKKLMKYPFLTLEECAIQSGFSSLQYFCRAFKKENGISPGRYRSDEKW